MFAEAARLPHEALVRCTVLYIKVHVERDAAAVCACMAWHGMSCGVMTSRAFHVVLDDPVADAIVGVERDASPGWRAIKAAIK